MERSRPIIIFTATFLVLFVATISYFYSLEDPVTNDTLTASSPTLLTPQSIETPSVLSENFMVRILKSSHLKAAALVLVIIALLAGAIVLIMWLVGSFTESYNILSQKAADSVNSETDVPVVERPIVKPISQPVNSQTNSGDNNNSSNEAESQNFLSSLSWGDIVFYAVLILSVVSIIVSFTIYCKRKCASTPTTPPSPQSTENNVAAMPQDAIKSILENMEIFFKKLDTLDIKLTDPPKSNSLRTIMLKSTSVYSSDDTATLYSRVYKSGTFGSDKRRFIIYKSSRDENNVLKFKCVREGSELEFGLSSNSVWEFGKMESLSISEYEALVAVILKASDFFRTCLDSYEGPLIIPNHPPYSLSNKITTLDDLRKN